jgi:hypothetical protein
MNGHQKKDREMEYLLQNVGAGYIGNSPVFYHASGSGYTQWIDEAKRFTLEEAETVIRTTFGSHCWMTWSVEQIWESAKRTVDIQDLRKLDE